MNSQSSTRSFFSANGIDIVTAADVGSSDDALRATGLVLLDEEELLAEACTADAAGLDFVALDLAGFGFMEASARAASSALASALTLRCCSLVCALISIILFGLTHWSHFLPQPCQCTKNCGPWAVSLVCKICTRVIARIRTKEAAKIALSQVNQVIHALIVPFKHPCLLVSA
jgi:hypothetical protein